jgi:thioredoxin 1
MQTNKEYVLLDLTADWCQACKQMKPVVEKALEGVSNVTFIEVNVDENPDLARKYMVRSIPMLILLKDEEVVGTLVGLKKVGVVEEFLKRD